MYKTQSTQAGHALSQPGCKGHPLSMRLCWPLVQRLEQASLSAAVAADVSKPPHWRLCSLKAASGLLKLLGQSWAMQYAQGEHAERAHRAKLTGRACRHFLNPQPCCIFAARAG